MRSSTGRALRRLRPAHRMLYAARDYSGTFNITDYRWFNLRDSVRDPTSGPFSFASDGLL